MSDYYAKPESWMLGQLCEVCDDEIDEGQPVVVLDIDWSDRRGAVAKIKHAACPCDVPVRCTGDVERMESR